jgi:hypothetical protein
VDCSCPEDLAWLQVEDPARSGADYLRQLFSDRQQRQEPVFHCFRQEHYGGCFEKNKYETTKHEVIDNTRLGSFVAFPTMSASIENENCVHREVSSASCLAHPFGCLVPVPQWTPFLHGR